MDFGVILDVETTGLNKAEDRIIELALIEFGVEGDKAPQILQCYSGLSDPGVPLSDDISRLTGLSDAELKGRTIEWSFVRTLLARASIVIAHNAEFDRGFVEATPELSGLKLHWGCSLRHIDWRKRHFASSALNYLAADHGFVNPFPHRALFDCATTFKLISPHLAELIERSYEREYRVVAVGSPFDTKDALKQRGYRWDPGERVWSRVVSESSLGDERLFLTERVYRGATQHAEVPL